MPIHSDDLARLGACEDIVTPPRTRSRAARHSARGRASCMEARRPRRDRAARG